MLTSPAPTQVRRHSKEASPMTKTVRSAVVAAMIGAAALGLVGVATAASGPQEQQVVNYLTGLLQDFDAQAGSLSSLDDPAPTQELEATTASYSSGAAGTGTQTVVVKVYQNLGAAPPATWFKAFSYDNAAKAPVTFGTLFRAGSTPLEVIAPMVARQLSADAGQVITIDPAVGLDPATYQNFAVTDDAVLFFFDRDQLHPAYGETEVSIPRAALAGLLSPGL